MSIDRNEAYARARDVRPFSNGDEGYAWMANWCDRCAVDAPYRSGIAAMGCPLIELALLGKTPAEWIEQDPLSLGDRYHCVQFRPRGGGGGEPKPQATPPGQGELVPRDDYTGVRMYERQREAEVVT